MGLSTYYVNTFWGLWTPLEVLYAHCKARGAAHCNHRCMVRGHACRNGRRNDDSNERIAELNRFNVYMQQYESQLQVV